MANTFATKRNVRYAGYALIAVAAYFGLSALQLLQNVL